MQIELTYQEFETILLSLSFRERLMYTDEEDRKKLLERSSEETKTLIKRFEEIRKDHPPISGVYNSHEIDHSARWISDHPKTDKQPYGGPIHFECSDPTCIIYSSEYRCPECGRRMDFQEKKNGHCGDCELLDFMKSPGTIILVEK